MRLNLGCGMYPLEGWTNVDAHCPAEIQGDVRELAFEDVDEVNMSHLLEHLSWRETTPVLKRVRSWMNPSGKLTIEVPDMDAIMALGTEHLLWFKYVYGDQSHDGELHLAGFTGWRLADLLQGAGWRLGAIVRFRSEHKGRESMPCLLALAYA